MKVILTGSIAYDYLMKFPGLFKDTILPEHIEKISLSFLVHEMIRQDGGVGANIAYSMALLGAKPYLFSTVGQDFGEYAQRLQAVGVDTSGVRVIPEKFTASFFATTDPSNAQIASFYTGAMANSAELGLAEADFDKNDLVMISPTDPGAMKRYIHECQELGLRMLFDPGQQIISMDAEDIIAGVNSAHGIFVNEYEFELLQNKTGFTAEEITSKPEFCVVTLGGDGAKIYAKSEEYSIPIVEGINVIDPTGVGDAFRAGFLRGYLGGLSLPVCGQMGAVTAAISIQHPGPQCHHFDWHTFNTQFREHFDDHGELDKLD
ncbi:MAG: carbohydrate kinase family protein [Chloroflexi bacterium]|nr:carbohydrate kinase family protein [Chloroflexota bacterium]